jgi:protein-disulfide isomerase
MRNFRLLFLFIISLCCALSSTAQRLEDVLASSSKTTYTAASLSPGVQKYYLERRKIIADTRAELLNRMIADAVLDLEAKALGSTPEKLLADQQNKVRDPTPAEVQKFYDANLVRDGSRPLEEIRPQLITYLKERASENATSMYIQSLRTKYKVVPGKDVNGIGMSAADVVATIGTRTITLGEFEQKNKVHLNDTSMQIYEEIRADLESTIFSAVAAEEAKSKNLDAQAFFAEEVTDKLRLFTDEEKSSIETALMKRLFTKYAVKITLAEPAPLVQEISFDADDPQTGSASAPVTVVMFTDFQCPACSRTHPVLKRTLAEYGDKIRFIVRDFPLEQIHENAFQAALAANAARAQGKFVEYTDVLYRNQDALDKASLLKYASGLGLNAKQFELDFNDAKAIAEVRKDQADGRDYGVSGTPTIFVNGIKVQRLSAEAFRRAVDRALSK